VQIQGAAGMQEMQLRDAVTWLLSHMQGVAAASAQAGTVVDMNHPSVLALRANTAAGGSLHAALQQWLKRLEAMDAELTDS